MPPTPPRTVVAAPELPSATGTPPAAQRQVADVDFETQCSVTSESECPICYQLFCEPVLAGCGRHVFCRNCLLKSQRLGHPLRCPVCRAACLLDATDIAEVSPLVLRIRLRDSRYDERLEAAKQERQEILEEMQRKKAAQELQAGRSFEEVINGVRWMPCPRGRSREVSGAGQAEVNGVFVSGLLPTYVGPTVYRKPNTYLFIFRWQQTQWAIAELHGPYSMGDERDWLYKAPTQYPPDVPPVHGWEVAADRRACYPAPEVRISNSPGPRIRDHQQRRNRNAVTDQEESDIPPRGPRGLSGVAVTNSGALADQEPEGETVVATQPQVIIGLGDSPTSVQARTTCKCTPCALM